MGGTGLHVYPHEETGHAAMLQHGSPAEEAWHTQQIAPGSPLSARTNANPRLPLTHGQGPHSREARPCFAGLKRHKFDISHYR
jgi:hypothetical protein